MGAAAAAAAAAVVVLSVGFSRGEDERVDPGMGRSAAGKINLVLYLGPRARSFPRPRRQLGSPRSHRATPQVRLGGGAARGLRAAVPAQLRRGEVGAGPGLGQGAGGSGELRLSMEVARWWWCRIETRRQGGSWFL